MPHASTAFRIDNVAPVHALSLATLPFPGKDKNETISLSDVSHGLKRAQIAQCIRPLDLWIVRSNKTKG